jgi:hypothetical protein
MELDGAVSKIYLRDGTFFSRRLDSGVFGRSTQTVKFAGAESGNAR